MASRAAQRCWQELRQLPISDACALADSTLPTSALLRRRPSVLHRLDALAEAAALAASGAGGEAAAAAARARRASLLDLRGSHDEALAILESERAGLRPQPLAAAARLLEEMVGRHARFASERRTRLEGAVGGGGGGTRPVEVLDATNTSAAELAERFVRPGLPCVLRGAPSVPRWTPRELRERLGSRHVPLRRCVDTSAAWARLEFAGSVPFRDFFAEHIEPALCGDVAEAAGARSGAPQLFDFSVWQSCEDVFGDEVLMPEWFPLDLYTHASARVHPVSGSASPTLFLAAGGTSSGLHVDFLQTHFWMGLCHGRKRWRLVPREDLPLLYPQYLADLNPAFPMDLDEAGIEAERADGAFPASRLLTVYEVVLQPGDLIFVPCGWPHQVENLETTVAISANFIDDSNLAAARYEAEVLGLVHEDPQILAGMLREAEASGLPAQLAASAAQARAESGSAGSGEPLREFKARHGERRAPRETQALLTRAGQALVLGGLALCAMAGISRWRRQ